MTIYTVYKVNYSATGSSGGSIPRDPLTTSGRGYMTGARVTIAPGIPTKTGASFAGWNTKANGSGPTYLAGQTFLMGSANVILYAVWAYPVTYNANGGSGAVPVDPAFYPKGARVTVPASSLTKAGATFSGWSVPPGALYNAGQSFLMGASALTLYATWTYHVLYNANGATTGTAPSDSHLYVPGNRAFVLENSGTLVKTKYTFLGWNTLASGAGVTYEPGDTLTVDSADVTLYASWALATVASGLSITYLSPSGTLTFVNGILTSASGYGVEA